MGVDNSRTRENERKGGATSTIIKQGEGKTNDKDERDRTTHTPHTHRTRPPSPLKSIPSHDVATGQVLHLLARLHEETTLGHTHGHLDTATRPNGQARVAGLAVDGEKVQIIVEASENRFELVECGQVAVMARGKRVVVGVAVGVVGLVTVVSMTASPPTPAWMIPSRGCQQVRTVTSHRRERVLTQTKSESNHLRYFSLDIQVESISYNDTVGFPARLGTTYHRILQQATPRIHHVRPFWEGFWDHGRRIQLGELGFTRTISDTPKKAPFRIGTRGKEGPILGCVLFSVASEWVGG